MKQLIEDSPPAWGVLPIEQYLMAKWDSESSLPAQEQHARLVHAFLQEDRIDSVSPGSAEPDARQQELIRSVFMPWRNSEVRQIAHKLVAICKQLSGELILLRTYYGGGAADDDRLRAWLDQADPFDESFGRRDDHWWRVLDNAALFDMSAEKWEAIRNVLPELAAPRLDRTFNQGDVDDVQKLVLPAAGDEEPDEDSYKEAIMNVAAVGHYLIVLDQEAFEDEVFLLVFQDKKGNLVKQGSIKPAEVQNLLQYASRGALHSSEYWLDAEIGSKYKTRGQVMRALLPVVMENAG
ncbi:hypothetical protein S40293_08368 [Stachybotrys chartarum IBT 40293]|nr:hypothetical protein S40293_08368 [Stachybotrys chartarum IBT 40293]